jgi:PhzF family phenazine biosynthesis protein
MRRFELIDVFENGPFSGNPLAVVHAAGGMSDAQMQAMTRWFNLSETAFLLPPTVPAADYKVRIFTLERELPFAGHPTLGSCRAWLAAGGRPRHAAHVVQECGIGLVNVRQDSDRLAFAAPPLIRSGAIDAAMRARVAKVLQIDDAAIVDAAWIDNGPGWVGVLLASDDAVRAVMPLRSHPERIEIGVVGLCAPGSDVAYEVRALFSDAHGGIIEDPVTGSLNASVAQWLIDSGRVSPPYTAAQGSVLGRTGRIRIDRNGAGTIWVGGRATIRVSGTVAAT